MTQRTCVAESVLPGFRNSHPAIKPMGPWTPFLLLGLGLPVCNTRGPATFPAFLVDVFKKEGKEGRGVRNKKEDGASVLRPGFCLLSGRVFEGAWNETETVVGEATSQPEPSASVWHPVTWL